MRALLLVSVCLFAAPAMSEVYRCADGVYQSDPCDQSSKPVDLSQVGSVIENNNKMDSSSVKAYVHNQKVEREISRLVADRDRVLKSRDRQLRELKQRSSWANNNLAGATWQQSLAQEMGVITQQADTLVSTIDRQIAQLRTQFNQ